MRYEVRYYDTYRRHNIYVVNNSGYGPMVSTFLISRVSDGAKVRNTIWSGEPFFISAAVTRRGQMREIRKRIREAIRYGTHV